MSMIPFFPSLTPPLTNSLWFDVDIPCDDESDVVQLETDHQSWINTVSQIATDLHPIGKAPVEHLDGPDTDDEDANDESESDADSSHDEEDDDEMEELNVARNNTERDPRHTFSPDARIEP